MRKNTARHWLHGALDLLPVLLIPVFMIYSHRHDMTQQTQVDIQYKYQSNEVNQVSDLQSGNLYYFDLEDTTFDEYYAGNSDFKLVFVTLDEYYFEMEDIELDEIYTSQDEIGGDTSFVLSVYNNFVKLELYLNYVPANYYFVDFSYDAFNNNWTLKGNCIIYFDNLPNWNDFSVFSYTDYNEIESVDVHDETSSVMNVFLDNFNTAINKYFNMGNVFNMNNIYEWFNTNIFNGSAPVIMYSVYNIIVYEFIMDLLFLLYGLFMFFIDMCKRLMEKPLDSIK